MAMLAFATSRAIQAGLVLLGVSAVVFLILHLTGDPAVLLLPPDVSTADLAAFRHAEGFDRPIWEQYASFLRGLAHGDFGQSLRYHQPALRLVLERVPATLELALTALAIALLVAFPAGIVAAVRRGTLWDTALMGAALLGQSLPTFWLGIMLILLVSVSWGLLPTGGAGGPDHLILPALTLAGFSMARTARLVRSGMLEVLSEDYIRTARAKGVRRAGVLTRHALPNLMIPVVTVIGLDLGTLLGGAVITETIFAWPGVGQLAIAAIQYRDYPLVQADVFLVAAGYVLVNLAVDILYTVIDPRIRLEARR
jgi:peptide/nickel transport system permease protein